METISNFHNINVFNPQTSKANDSCRLAVIHYKSRKDKVGNVIPKFPSLCISVPVLRIALAAGTPTSVQSVTISLFEGLQDDLIRSIIDQRRSKDENGKPTATSMKTTIHDDEISLESIAAFAAATGNGKLSSDSIGQWYDLTLAEPMLAAILAADSERTDDQCSAILKNYREMLCKLAAVVPAIPAANIPMLRKALAKAPEDDATASRLITKLDSMTKPAAMALADIG